MELPIFKIRASAAHEILGGTIGLSDAQQIEYDTLTERASGFKEKKPGVTDLTVKMKENLSKLQNKIDNPELPSGAKTYCQKWVKEKLYDRRKNFANKYLEKGISCEDDSISYAADQLGWGEVGKNEEWFFDEWMEGTPDIIAELFSRELAGNNEVIEILTPTVIDMKNVWDCFTLPLFEPDIPTEGYKTQLQVYMHLVSNHYKIAFNDALLCYTLMDAPLNVMEKEMRSLSWEQGERGLITDEIRQKVHKEMTYSDLEADLRLKVYNVKFSPSIIEELKLRVELCRNYIPTLKVKRVN